MFLKSATGPVKVSSKVKVATFRFIGYRGGINNSCEAKPRQNTSQGMENVPSISIGLIPTRQGPGQVKYLKWNENVLVSSYASFVDG